MILCRVDGPKGRQECRRTQPKNVRMRIAEGNLLWISYLFRVTLPAHPEYLAIFALRDVAQLEAVGDNEEAFQRLASAQSRQPESTALTARLIEVLARRGNLGRAREVFDAHSSAVGGGVVSRVGFAMAHSLMDGGNFEHARGILDSLTTFTRSEESIEAAILEKRAQRLDRAHALFEQAGEAVRADARALHEFAQVKMKLAQPTRLGRRRQNGVHQATRSLLLREAKEMLQRVLQLPAGDQRHAWAWLDLGKVCTWAGEPAPNARIAFRKAIELAPHDEMLQRQASQALEALGDLE